MWTCPNCGEEHDDRFETCWKCGTDASGDSDPNFHVSEPIADQEQDGDSASNEDELPSLALPALSYFSIPPFIWIRLAMLFNDPEKMVALRMHDLSWSPIDIVSYSLAMILIGMPMLFVVVRAGWICTVRQKGPSNSSESLLWLLSIFRLPEDFCSSHRWFVPVYYLTIAIMLTVPFVISLWQLTQYN